MVIEIGDNLAGLIFGIVAVCAVAAIFITAMRSM